jgi:hypothetical protein
VRDLENELDKVGGHSAGGEQAGDSESGAKQSGPVSEDEPVRRVSPRAGSELASYWISSGERLLICAQGKFGLDVLDVAADFLGETYRVDRAFEDEAPLWALVDDYLAQARRLDAPPMSGQAITAVMFRRSDD